MPKLPNGSMKKYFTDKRTRRACHIYGMLRVHAHKRHISFHTPGHKVGKWDITELSFSDNLSAPRGCIAQAERDIARLTSAAASFILTDGSTSGVLSMLHVAKRTGVRVLITPSQPHKSVYNGCALFGIELLSVDEATLLSGEGEWAERADGVLVVSPDYYGRVPPLQKIKSVCERLSVPLLIDGAHGGHLRYRPDVYAGTYADLWVDGVHKSLPALTQGAVVSAKSEGYARELAVAVDVFRTTSPSYPIMASVEYAVKYPENARLEEDVRAAARLFERLTVREDYTKLCAAFGENAFAAQAHLENEGIYAEFCDGNVVCFYLSPATKKKDFYRLLRALDKAFQRFPLVPQACGERIPAPLVFDKDAPTEWVEIERATGRIAAANCGLFPPCTPLIRTGERIEEEKLRLLQKANNVFGVWQNKLCVFVTNEKE